MLPQNLLVPLIGLGLYTQANNLNLCNNTAMMIIILALIMEQKEIQDLCDENDNDSGDTYNSYNGNQYTNNSQQPTATFAQPVYSTVPVYYNNGYNTCGCNNGYGYSNCGCNNGYNGYGYSNCGCNGYRTYNNGYSTCNNCNSCNSCNNGYYYNRSSNICGCGTTIY